MAFRPPSATQTLTASGSVTAWGPIVLVNSATAVTVTLPKGFASDVQKPTEIKNIGAGAVTVAAFVGDVLTGQSVLTQNTAVTYEVSSAGVIQSVADIGAAATSTALSYARITAFQAGSTAVNANSLAQVVCASAANVSSTVSAVGQRVPFTAADGTSSSTTVGTNIVTVANTGQYSIDAGVMMQTQGANTAMGLQIVKNGNVLHYMSAYPGGGAALVTVPVEWSGLLTAGDVIDLRVVSVGLASTINVHSVALNINELPTATTVPAGSVTVTALANGSAFAAGSTAIAPITLATSVVAVSVTLPNIGTYEIHTRIRGGSTAATSHALESALFLNPTSTTFNTAGGGTLVANSEVLAFFSTAANPGVIQATGSGISIVTTTVANTVINMQVWASSTGATLMSDNNGRSGLVYSQMPAATVVNPGTVPVATISKLRIRRSGGSMQAALGLYSFAINNTSSKPAVGTVPSASGVLPDSSRIQWVAGDVDLVDGPSFTAGTNFITSNYTGRVKVSAKVDGGLNGLNTGGNTWTIYLVKGGLAGTIIDVSSANEGASNTYGGDTAWIIHEFNIVAGETLDIRANATAGNLFVDNQSFMIEMVPTTTVVDPGTVPVTTLVYGENVSLTNNQTTASLTLVDVTNGSIPLPSAGQWEVTYIVNVFQNTNGQSVSLAITDASNVVVQNSVSNTSVTTNNVNGATVLTNTVKITTTGATTYKLRWSTGGTGIATLSNVSSIAGASAGASSKVFWNQLPVATVIQVTPGALVATALGYASGSTPSFSPTAVGDVPFTVVDASGIANTGTTFTLLANKRYYMDARLGFNSNTGASCQIGYQIVRADNSAITGVVAGLWMNQVSQATGGGESPGSTGFFTPTVDTLVKVRVTVTTGSIAGASTSGVFLIQEQAVTSLVNPSSVPVNTLMPAQTVFDGAYNTTVGNVGHANGATFTPTVTGTYAVTVGGSAWSPAAGFSITNIALRQGATVLQGKSASIYMTTTGPHQQLTSKTFYQALTAGTVYNVYVVSGSNATIDAGDFWTVELEQLTTGTVIVAGSVPAATAATDAAAGTAGYPAISPAIGDNRKALFGDLTFKQVPQVYSSALSYAVGDVALLGDQAITPVAAIPAATAFSWGATGATWRPVLSSQTSDNPLTWLGVYAAGTTYALGAVVAATAASTAALLVSQAAANLGNAVTTTYWQPMHNGAVQHAPSTPVVQRFTGTGTYTPTPGMKYCIVEAVGGGGAGYGAPANPGATAANYGASGAGGGYVKVLLTAAQISVGQVVTIGAGGVGGITGAGLAGSATSLGSLFSAVGGPGGPASVGYNSNFVGGLLSIARTSGVVTPAITTGTNMGLITTHPGLPSFVGGNASFFGYCMGDGGDSPMGVGAKAPTASNTSSSSSAVVAGASSNANTGGGGTSGMTYGAAAAAQSGGNGGSGLMTITEFFV